MTYSRPDPSIEDLEDFAHELKAITDALNTTEPDNRFGIELSGKSRLTADRLGLNSRQTASMFGNSVQPDWNRILKAFEGGGGPPLRIRESIEIVVDWIEQQSENMREAESRKGDDND
ncbi:MAG: hypothetical protein O2955_20840 [Planctomycetota bacterium]|nr:hypothetical protein [Planctomycetota bacterium]MDA1214958.1 hypothetical protein [Planctomycetota bacterium]